MKTESDFSCLASRSTRELCNENILNTYGRFDLEISWGEGCRVWDETGKSYLDFGAGIAVCSLGHAHPAVTRAVAEQAGLLVHTSNLYFTRPQAELAARLNEVVESDGRIFFCNSGAEANEGLYKLARRYGAATGRYEIITFKNSFHGRTLGGIAATGQEKVKQGFAPMVEGFRHAVFNDINSVREQLSEKTVAVLLEPIQGESGVHIAHYEFLQALAELCKERDLLLLFDEIQCGLGRTGDWCAWKSLVGTSVEPDAVSWAKGIANGMPLGAFWIRNRELRSEQGGEAKSLPELLGPGSHGTTYGGNPVSCAAALAVLETIQKEELLANVLELGAYLRDALGDINHPAVAEVRAIGLMIGLGLNKDFLSGVAGGVSPAIFLSKQLMAAGLLVIPAGEETIRLLPPLNVRREEIDEAVGIISEFLEKL
ncbi:MAG: aspartate aminotransferase family protein [Chthoniobacterales bacterium]